MTPLELSDWLRNPRRRPLVMGVLNLTPDSFSDGGELATPLQAVDRARQMIADGADWLDLGGESTRPGAQRVSASDQIARVIPALKAIRTQLPSVILSIDTTLADVAEAALDAGADVVNDISAGRDDPRMLSMVARRSCPVILMHMQGQPATMQIDPRYADVVGEVRQFLAERIATATEAGIARECLLIDPGFGFGKTLEHNLQILRRLSDFASLALPLVVGVSRKRFIGAISGEASRERLFGTAAAISWAVANQASVLRVHDVGPMSQVVRSIRAIQSE